MTRCRRADRDDRAARCRGVSTVIDVVIALSLVSAAAVVLVTADSPGERSTDPGFRAPPVTDFAGTLLATTIEVSYDAPAGRRTVRGPAGVLLADAAVAAAPPVTDAEAAFVAATRAEVRETLRLLGPGVAVAAAAPPASARRSRPLVRVGPTPPPGIDVDAVVYRFSSGDPASPRSVTLVVRTWLT